MSSPESEITGRALNLFLPITLAASLSFVPSVTVTGSRVMTEPTVKPGSVRVSTTANLRSLSVTIPASFPFSSTGA